MTADLHVGIDHATGPDRTSFHRMTPAGPRPIGKSEAMRRPMAANPGMALVTPQTAATSAADGFSASRLHFAIGDELDDLQTPVAPPPESPQPEP